MTPPISMDPVNPVRATKTLKLSGQAVLLQAGALQNAVFSHASFFSIAGDANGEIQIFNVGAERMPGDTAAVVLNQVTPAEISDPDELVTRAKALSAGPGTAITPGFEALVFKAAGGSDMARSAQSDVMLMDINLTAISALEALRRLATDPATAHVPVVALSAKAMQRDIDRGMIVDFLRHLTKVIRMNELMDTLAVALQITQGKVPAAAPMEGRAR